MDPRSGQILAIASTPSFDNNVYGPPLDASALRDVAAAPGSPMLDHVTQAVAPPGSTFKLVVAAANQADPVFAPKQAIPTGADFTYGGHTFGNWKPMGPMNLPESIAMSNDVYFYKLAVALGPDAMIDTARALGVGQRTGIDLPAEAGRVPGHARLRPRERRHLVRRVDRHPRHRAGLPAGHAAAERAVDRRGRHREAGHAPAGSRGRDG
jgi:cell division protein FtsI/penicillin-binding protein 2